MEPGEEIEALVDELEQIISDAKSPFGGGGQRKIVDAQDIFEILDEIKPVVVKAPVHIGDVIIPDVAGTGVDIIATKNIVAV